MKYRCFIAALLLHLLIGAIFFIPDKNMDIPKSVYIHAYLVKNYLSSAHSSSLREQKSSPVPSSRDLIAGSSIHKTLLDPRVRKDDIKKHKSDNEKRKNENNNEHKSQVTKLTIYLHDQIQQNLVDANLPDSMQNQKIQIEFTLTNTGIIKDIKLQQSTGFRIIDQEIVDSVANVNNIPTNLLLSKTKCFYLNIILN